MSFFESFIDEIEARTRIQDALFLHSRGIDRNDHAGTRALAYHDDAVVDSGHGRQPVKDLLTARSAEHDHTHHTAHLITNILIEFVSRNLAFVESHVFAVEYEGAGYDFTLRAIPDPGSAGARILSWGRYADIFECRNGTWKIRERAVIFGDTTYDSLETEPVLPPNFPGQRHDLSDPLYRYRDRAQNLARAKADAAGHDVNPEPR
jgi:hypothetical protein